MKPAQILAVALALLGLVSCGTPGAPMPPSLQLPQPVSDLKAVRKGDQVSLSWTAPRETTDKANLTRPGPTRICRSIGEAVIDECPQPVGVLLAPQTPAGTKVDFSDVLPQELQRENPTAFATFAVEAVNDRGRSAGFSNQVRVAAAPTLPPPDDFRAQLTPDGPVLMWTGQLHEHESPELGHFFRVYRRVEGGETDAVLGEVRLRTQPEVAMPDRNFEWEKVYIYRLTVVTTVTHAGALVAEVEGADSPPLKVFAHDVFPPAAPSGLQAVFSGLEQQRFIDLTWAPNTESDLAGYNVFRHVGGAAAVKVNTELVKTPAFRDASVSPGTTYYYAVSAVDLRGNESGKSEEAHESVPQ